MKTGLSARPAARLRPRMSAAKLYSRGIFVDDGGATSVPGERADAFAGCANSVSPRGLMPPGHDARARAPARSFMHYNADGVRPVNRDLADVCAPSRLRGRMYGGIAAGYRP